MEISEEIEALAEENNQNGDVDILSAGEASDELGVYRELTEKEKPMRIIRKAKRMHPGSSGNELHQSVLVNGNNNAVSKNSRKSRSGRGRGQPKKGGAGGKGTWGAPGDELYADRTYSDAKDPNYDSESEEEYVVERIEPEISEEELGKIVEPIILEYYDHGSVDEVKEALSEINLGNNKSRIMEIAVNLALDHKASHRELTSVLIADLCGKLLTNSDVEKGFDHLLRSLTDLTIDTPDAPTVIGQFMARAVADDCLPPKFLSTYKGKVDCEHTQFALEKAELLLSKKHGIVRLDNIWGTGGGIRPVKYLIKQIVLLLKEYLSSGDIAEATRCLQNLEVPHFHHELVYEATYLVLEDGSERSATRMCQLFKSLSDYVIITPEQFSQGFRRVCDNLPDICLDVPLAYSLQERFGEMCHREGIMSNKDYQDIPQRGRKRFVSEGDGGRVKDAVL
ncbi:hypothetical protein ACJMK2_005993 [Sinanodonta woodiana]|uniref:Programmed cell death protein 4 n=1 Tax=Sinanodonta woodiana TaxID=1069815 RepID=A0ABD3VSI8_SINWO